jgi:hypothetical protein
MSEITKSVLLSGYRLNKKDLEQLCECVAEGITGKSDLTLSFKLKDREIRKDGTEQLFGDASIPPTLHNLTLVCSSPLSSSSGYRRVVLSLGEQHSSLYIVGDDEIWVEGKCQQIKNFLQHRVSKARRLLSEFGAAIVYTIYIAVFLLTFPFGNKTSRWMVLVFGALTLIVFGVLGQRIVHLNVIHLRYVRESWLKRNASTLLAAVLGAAIGAVITFALTKFFP